MPYQPPFDLRGKKIENTYQQLLQYNTASGLFYNGNGVQQDVSVSYASIAALALTANTASYVASCVSASWASQSFSTSYSPWADYAFSASWASQSLSASWAPSNAIVSASWASQSFSTSYSPWADYAFSASWASQSLSASWAPSNAIVSASWASQSLAALYSSASFSASYASRSFYATSASWASQSLSASWAANTLTASYIPNVGTVIYTDVISISKSFGNSGDGLLDLSFTQSIGNVPKTGIYRLTVVAAMSFISGANAGANSVNYTFIHTDRLGTYALTPVDVPQFNSVDAFGNSPVGNVNTYFAQFGIPHTFQAIGGTAIKYYYYTSAVGGINAGCTLTATSSAILELLSTASVN
jgi:hypothetical protein